MKNSKSNWFKEFYILIFLVALSLQAWRGFAANGFGIVKAFIQLHDLKTSHKTVFRENEKMLTQLQDWTKNPKAEQIKKAIKEFNLVQNPDKEVLIQLEN